MANTMLLQDVRKQPQLMILDNGQLLRLDLTAPVTVGRPSAGQSPTLALRHDYVSREQGEFGRDSYGWYYTDTGSRNGTYYNGAKLQPQARQNLTGGDVLQILNGEPQTAADFVTIVYLTDYPEQFEVKCIPLDLSTAEINVGRVGKGIVMNAPTVSAHHASFFTAREGWAVTDHGSKNGVFLNGCRIDRPYYLRMGDSVRIANLQFFFLGNALLYQSPLGQQTQPEHPALDIHIVERSVWQRAKKLMLLQNIDLTIAAGEMVLILGGSGAGKTTFMNAVMGYEKAEGRILHGDTDVYENFESMKYKIGFVPQQDLLRGSDTVYDTLENAAEMKLPNSMKRAQKLERIEQVLQTLGLQRERNSLVSKLSGGQRKRLSIAVEYIADPSLFFLDEPDSGLDGIMARTLMENLRTIADEGKIVMVISHGPDRAAELFDKVVVLAKSAKDNCGHLAFFGTPAQAREFFDTPTLEGVVRRINRPDEGGDGLSDYYIEKYGAMQN